MPNITKRLSQVNGIPWTAAGMVYRGPSGPVMVKDIAGRNPGVTGHCIMPMIDGYHRKMSIFETWNTCQSNDTMRFPQS